MEISSIVNKALNFQKSIKQKKTNKPKNIFNLFLEASTRTTISFELAAKKLGHNVINVNFEKSSLSKGETFNDTMDTLISMKPDALIIRDKNNFSPHEIFQKHKIPILNAGDGTNEHPTQALLDLCVIKSIFKNKKMNLASLLDGASIIACNNEHFGKAQNILAPGKAKNMGDGCETRRRRDKGNDWLILNSIDGNFIDKIDNRVNRGRKDLKGSCAVYGSNANIEIHHVRSLKKRPKKGYFLSDIMSKMNRKQVPLCKSCHFDVHSGLYDEKSFRCE